MVNVGASLVKDLLNGKVGNIDQMGLIYVYKRSITSHGADQIAMVKLDGIRRLLVAGVGTLYHELSGTEIEEDGFYYKWCDLSHHNRKVLNTYFGYTLPQAMGTQIATIGLGDRLGIASPGHIKTVMGKNIRPILAQQSIRELTLTGRKYEDVMDAASFAVFQEGYRDGWGADGDHLKTVADIEMAIGLGFSMITLDASEYIDNNVPTFKMSEVEGRYKLLDVQYRSRVEQDYANRKFPVGDVQIELSYADLQRYVLIYGKAITFIIDIYRRFIATAVRPIDFEISIDETFTPTDPAAHWFVASELIREHVHVNSMAPRFCGDFQKGIDYIGDLNQFEHEFATHVKISDYFGYKLSIHSGSDKFSVFPIIAKYTKGRFHLKTAGTNWLEAMRTIAKVNPSLYRKMHEYALNHVEEALKFYHITANFTEITPLSKMTDAELPEYMYDNNARQLIHITYGILLTAKDDSGKLIFKDEFYETLSDHEEAYETSLISHIGKHLRLLEL